MNNFDHVFDYALSDRNPGFRPSVVELPNGDGRADTGKRYTHVAIKYGLRNAPFHIQDLFWGLCAEAAHTAHGAGLPSPDPLECCLRLLEYPAGAGSEAHLDFDLFTLNVWRTPAGGLLVPADHRAGRVHFGELSPLFGGPEATWHAVSPLPVPQRSIVFFAVCSALEEIPGTQTTVGDWLAERKGRSRKVSP